MSFLIFVRHLCMPIGASLSFGRPISKTDYFSERPWRRWGEAARGEDERWTRWWTGSGDRDGDSWSDGDSEMMWRMLIVQAWWKFLLAEIGAVVLVAGRDLEWHQRLSSETPRLFVSCCDCRGRGLAGSVREEVEMELWKKFSDYNDTLFLENAIFGRNYNKYIYAVNNHDAGKFHQSH